MLKLTSFNGSGSWALTSGPNAGRRARRILK